MRLNTQTWGDPAAPRSAVLIHGVTSNAASWARVGPALAARGFYVVAAELRGHGGSPKAPSHYTLGEMVADLAESVPAAPTLLVGHSFGGVMAILAHQQGILRPAYVALEDPVLHFADQATPARLLSNDEASLPRDVAGTLRANPRWLPIDAEGKVASLQAISWPDMHEVFAHNAPWDLRPALRVMARATPTCIIMPENSFYVPPPDAAAIEADLGAQAIARIPGVGHSVHRDDIDAFLQVIDELVRR